jgi:hypothetical protein
VNCIHSYKRKKINPRLAGSPPAGRRDNRPTGHKIEKMVIFYIVIAFVAGWKWAKWVYQDTEVLTGKEARNFQRQHDRAHPPK